MDIVQQKRCSRCKQSFPATPEFFYRNKHTKDGFQWECKTCQKGSSKTALKAYHAKLKLTAQNRRDAASSSAKACSKCGVVYPSTTDFFYKSDIGKDGLLTSCKACHGAKCKEWREENLEHWQTINRANSKQWQLDHPEEAREQRRISGKKWRQNNPERANEVARNSAKRCRARHKMDILAGAHNQRAKMRKARGRIKAKDLNQIYDSQKGLCWWCGKPLDHKWQLDHRIALAKGGSNELDNLCCACPDCNARKSDKWPWQFNGRLI
jgi:hypothetical protein